MEMVCSTIPCKLATEIYYILLPNSPPNKLLVPLTTGIPPWLFETALAQADMLTPFGACGILPPFAFIVWAHSSGDGRGVLGVFEQQLLSPNPAAIASKAFCAEVADESELYDK
jgi:hypothetical protein